MEKGKIGRRIFLQTLGAQTQKLRSELKSRSCRDVVFHLMLVDVVFHLMLRWAVHTSFFKQSNLLWISNSRVLTCCNLDIFIVFVVACFLNVMSFSSVSIQNTHLLWLCFFKCKAKHYIASSMVWFYCYLIFHSYCFKFIQLSVPSWYFFLSFFFVAEWLVWSHGELGWWTLPIFFSFCNLELSTSWSMQLTMASSNLVQSCISSPLEGWSNEWILVFLVVLQAHSRITCKNHRNSNLIGFYSR